MIDDIINNFETVYIFVGLGILSVVLILIYLRSKKSNSSIVKVSSKGKLEGYLIYDYGKKVLERSIELDGTNQMEMSIGPEYLTDNHMKLKDGISFKFTVSAVKSRSGDSIINIKCHPPGILIYNGKVMSDINMYNGWEIMMNNIPIRYESGQVETDGENQLKGRV